MEWEGDEKNMKETLSYIDSNCLNPVIPFSIKYIQPKTNIYTTSSLVHDLNIDSNWQ